MELNSVEWLVLHFKAPYIHSFHKYEQNHWIIRKTILSSSWISRIVLQCLLMSSVPPQPRTPQNSLNPLSPFEPKSWFMMRHASECSCLTGRAGRAELRKKMWGAIGTAEILKSPWQSRRALPSNGWHSSSNDYYETRLNTTWLQEHFRWCLYRLWDGTVLYKWSQLLHNHCLQNVGQEWEAVGVREPDYCCLG